MVKTHLPMNMAGSPIYTGFMMVFAVDLLYDLVHPHITVAHIILVAVACTCDHIHQHGQEPLSPYIAWHIQSGGGPV
jgi:hypothetical protein